MTIQECFIWNNRKTTNAVKYSLYLKRLVKKTSLPIGMSDVQIAYACKLILIANSKKIHNGKSPIKHMKQTDNWHIPDLTERDSNSITDLKWLS